MTIPERAIVCTPTYEEAVKFKNFLEENSDLHVNAEDWENNGEEHCYDLMVDNATGELLSADRGFYEESCIDVDNGHMSTDARRWVPLDKSWRFVTVDEFIARCACDGEIQEDETQFEVDDLI